LSGLLKKRIRVDRNLGQVVGVPEGTTVSYAEIQKGLHKYIRENNLRTDVAGEAAPAAGSAQPDVSRVEPRGMYCISCGEAIPTGSAFCDLCGTMQ
jgi:hypothetical protein